VRKSNLPKEALENRINYNELGGVSSLNGGGIYTPLKGGCTYITGVVTAVA